MNLARSLRGALVGVACAVALVACTRPSPPQVTAKSARVTNVSLQGIDLEAELAAYNPNDIDLHIQSVTAKVVLDHRYDVGTFTENKPVTLPAKKRTNVRVPVHVRWADMMGLVELATSRRDIDYLVDGDVELGAEMLRVQIPFQVHGVVTHQQLEQAAGRAIPGGIPRIPGVTAP
ncbi:MAG TPA: LEA type 2 family protein [Byssovorax sp.]|jgi:LEA14-like dessication related protein